MIFSTMLKPTLAVGLSLYRSIITSCPGKYMKCSFENITPSVIRKADPFPVAFVATTTRLPTFDIRVSPSINFFWAVFALSTEA